MNLLVLLYREVGNLGLAIIFLSFLVRLVMVPFFIPNLKTAKKQRDLKPELDKIKEKYKHDKKKQAEMQMELFRQHGINPASGCFTNIVTLLIPFALYGVINEISRTTDITSINPKLYVDWLKFGLGDTLNTRFLAFDIARPDRTFILPVLCAVLQFLSSKMMLPAINKAEKLAAQTAPKSDDMLYNMQEQMLYMFPVMMLIFGFRLPSGVMLNIFVSTLFTLVQSYFVMGWGGLSPLVQKLRQGFKT
ncbi:MAG: YidC/Oxa1 family membrane protein insertase [bacterium]